jgi:uncharacterized protein (TIGR02145 family)
MKVNFRLKTGLVVFTVAGFLLLLSCEKKTLPTVLTSSVSDITGISARVNGNLVNNGNSPISKLGVVWGTNPMPSVESNSGLSQTNITGTGIFTVNIMSLIPETKYYVRAFAVNETGIAYGDQVSFTTPEEYPVAAFLSSPVTYATVGQNVQFTDQSYRPAYWNWNFGDGETSTLKNPSHIYKAPGTYNVCLTVDNNAGNDSHCSYIIVDYAPGNSPVAAFTVSSISIILGQSVQFTDQSAYTPTTWNWDFGDGSKSTLKNPSHTYSETGVYTVSLTVTNNSGSNTKTKNDYVTVNQPGSAPVAGFITSSTNIYANQSVQFTDQSTNSPTSWSWNFGDGGTSTYQNPSHIYSNAGTYTVTLTATNSYGSDVETKSNYMVVNPSGSAPVAAFTASSTITNAGQNVQFTDQSLNNPTVWSWNFGDGGTSTARNPSHTYITAGTYTITLTATNSFGSDALTKSNYIVVNPSGSAPIAAFTASSTIIAQYQNVQFTDQSTNSPTSWNWNFGDGGTSTNQNPSHLYNVTGTYTVSLTIINSYGTDTETKLNYITVNPPVTDIDGNIYTEVAIGTQIWLKENLKTTKLNDGTPIQNVTDNSAWASTRSSAYCWYENDISNKPYFGALYNWYAVNSGMLCPAGWHVPGDPEWEVLVAYLGGSDIAGGKLKESGILNWTSPNTGASNESRFSALPGGVRSYGGIYNGRFLDILDSGFWWSETESFETNAWARSLYYESASIFRSSYVITSGLSVRCIKDS